MKTIDNRLAQMDLVLKVWARWYTHMLDQGLGYAALPWDKIIQPRHCQSGPQDKLLPVDEHAEATDAAINQLWQRTPELARVLHVYYLAPGNTRQQAQSMGLSCSRFKEHIRLAKIWLSAYLSGRQEMYEGRIVYSDR